MSLAIEKILVPAVVFTSVDSTLAALQEAGNLSEQYPRSEKHHEQT